VQTIQISSTRQYAGKIGICIALIKELEARGLDVGYFKPFGTMPERVEGRLTDQDAHYVNSGLRRPSPLEDVCPVVKTRELLETSMDVASDLTGTVTAAWERVCRDRDIVVVEGPTDVFQALTLQLSVCQLAQLLGAKVLLVDRPERMAAINDYPIVWAAGDPDLSGRNGQALADYVQRGGTLVVNVKAARGLPANLLGARIGTTTQTCTTWTPRTQCDTGTSASPDQAFSLDGNAMPASARCSATSPAATSTRRSGCGSTSR
jgi:dethiobiotin synthetase